jgi:hypothetical protein
MKDGTSFVDKFMDTGSGWIEFEERGRVQKKDIKNFSIHRWQNQD